MAAVEAKDMSTLLDETLPYQDMTGKGKDGQAGAVWREGGQRLLGDKWSYMGSG